MPHKSTRRTLMSKGYRIFMGIAITVILIALYFFTMAAQTIAAAG